MNRKIGVLGFRAVGKTAFAIQYIEDRFQEQYDPTIENTFHKVIKYKGQEYDLEIVDTMGQDEHSPIQGHFYVGMHGFVAVYSVTSKTSLEMVKAILDKIVALSGNASNIPLVLVGNKCDLNDYRQVPSVEGKAVADSLKIPFLECSAKTSHNVGLTFDTLIDRMEKTTNPQSGKEGCWIL